MTWDDFLDCYPEDQHFELIDRIIVAKQPTGKYEQIVEFLSTKLT